MQLVMFNKKYHGQTHKEKFVTTRYIPLLRQNCLLKYHPLADIKYIGL